MDWIRKHRPAPGTIFGLAALAIALGGVAFAAIPDSGGTIHACYQKNTGNLRVADPVSDCRTSEQAIDWNQQGKPGPGGDAHVLKRTTLADGETQALFAEGPFTIIASCHLNIPQSTENFFLDEAKIVVSTTEDHSAVSASFHRDEADIGPSSPESSRVLQDVQGFHFGGQQAFKRYSQNDFIVSAPSGTDIGGALFASSNALGQSGKCVFGGHLITPSDPTEK